ncbi:MAG: AMP-binding protein, partial [Actinomycetota bacterium]
MDFTPREPTTEQVERYIGEGFWTGRTVGQVLAEALGEAADRPFTVRSDRRPYRGTLGEVDALARRVASGLRSRGIGAGDVVSFQLPNWVEAAATFYACTYVGAVVVPIVHFYGPKEVGYILRKTRVRALITADRFGHQDFLANLDGLCDDLPDLEWVAVVGDDEGRGLLAFADLAATDPIAGPAAVDAARPALVAYTSGTTSNPKGVVHTHRSITAEIHQLAAMQAARVPLVDEVDRVAAVRGHEEGGEHADGVPDRRPGEEGRRT